MEILELIFSPYMSAFAFVDIWVMCLFIALGVEVFLAFDLPEIWGAFVGGSIGNWLSDLLGAWVDPTIIGGTLGITYGCFLAFAFLPFWVRVRSWRENRVLTTHSKQLDLFRSNGGC
tara:strand:- start:330 stop:680 length:351 start_codon:yes stop_codon:yes gene_type:complete